MACDVSSGGIEEKVGQLADLPRKELVRRWIQTHGKPPPKGIKRGLLERSHAYHLQARRSGRLKPATRKALLAVAEGKLVENNAPECILKPGARLVREWHGVTHQVEVVDTGFTWNGQTFGSLSAVAQAITGAKWSGPRFFGL